MATGQTSVVLLQLDGHHSTLSLLCHMLSLGNVVNCGCQQFHSYVPVYIHRCPSSWLNSDDAMMQFAFCSGMHIPHPQSHRVALVFYQTDLKVEDDDPADMKL